MRKEITKDDFKAAARDLLHSIRIERAVLNEEKPGSGDLLTEAVLEELQGWVPKTEQTTENANCCIQNCDECGYGSTVGMTFGDALAAVKKGAYIARKGWNGKNQYVMLASCLSYKGSAGEIVNCHHNDIGNKALAFVGTSGVQLGWLASQADMLAEDWYIVD